MYTEAEFGNYTVKAFKRKGMVNACDGAHKVHIKWSQYLPRLWLSCFRAESEHNLNMRFLVHASF